MTDKMVTDTRDPELARYDVVLTRLYDAPREDVFDAWSSEERLLRWFGPDLYPAVSFELDFRPGGAFELCMRGPNGEEARSKGEYVEIVPPERIVMLSRIEHEGAVVFEVLQTVTFAPVGEQTELTVEHRVQRNDGFPGAEGAQVGWEQTLARLGADLATTSGRVA
jgi:uncharacterized protein YndB with AHSA1/START domain